MEKMQSSILRAKYLSRLNLVLNNEIEYLFDGIDHTNILSHD